MNSSVGLPSSLTVEKIWWNNILLLGFDVQLNEKKYNTSFSSLMFKKTNVKGMEVMLHFLLFRLDPDRAKERFRSVFPVLEKSQGRDYRRVVLEELERLEKAGKLPPSTLRASLLQTCAGDRFYLMIWMLSVESIKEVIKREVGEKYLTLLPSPAASSNSSAPSLLPISAQARILSSHIALQSRNFLSTSKSMSDAQNSWKNFVNTLQSQINQALTSLSDFLQQEKEFEEDSKQLNLASFEELQQKIGQVRQTWDYLEQLEDDRDKENQCLDNFLNKKSESNLLLDGSSLRYSVPNALFHESILSHSDQSGNSQALQQQPVSLSQLAAMWNRSLIKIDEAFAQFPLDDEKLDQEIKEIDKALELQISHSSSLTSLNQKLEKEISDIQASIKVLQTQIDSSAFPPHLQPTLLSASSESLHSLPSSTHLSLVSTNSKL